MFLAGSPDSIDEIFMNKIDFVTQTICDTMGWSAADLGGDDLLQSFPGWDSVNQLRVLMAIESATGRRIPMKRFLAATTLDDIRELLQGLTSDRDSR